jgi:hypothetical protein
LTDNTITIFSDPTLHKNLPFVTCYKRLLIRGQYLDALKRFSPESASPDFRIFLDELDEAGAVRQENESSWLDSAKCSTDASRKSRAYAIQSAEDAREKLRYRQNSSDGGDGVRIWNGRSADATDSGVEMERDFTTPGGTPGRLKCPFVAPAKVAAVNPPSTNDQRGVATPRSSVSRVSLSARRSKRSSFHDPIRAETCGQRPVSTAPSIEGSIPLCPIRFLDQHSPEEVAQYFEKHKHELPRSHEVCVKRYQTNEASIRRLDSKYGNLINMIQGLGVKHKPMLPEVNDDEIAVDDEPDEPTSKDRVQNWATAVSVSLGADVEDPAEPLMEEDRESRFDRVALKDVRVGESPSRPWGITVPARYNEEMGAASAKSEPTAQLPGMQKPGACPFGHGQGEKPATTQPNPAQRAPSPPQQQQHQPRQEPTFINTGMETPPSKQETGMIFTGPVFIGYGMEQALALLQQSGYGPKS